MRVTNSEEIDAFLFEHKDNGCIGIKEGLVDEEGLSLNSAWRDVVTEEECRIQYECVHGKSINDYCLECGRIHNA